MMGFVQDIENLAVKNEEFRRVLSSASKKARARPFSMASGLRSGRASPWSSRPARGTTSSIRAASR